MTSSTHRLSTGTLARYAVGSLGTGGFATLPGLVLVYYLTDTLGVAAAAAGAIVAAAKIADILIDPVLGVLSDGDAARRGSRMRFMVLGALSLPVFFTVTFAVPGSVGAVAAAVWVTVAFVLSAISFSLFQVPYIALPAELTPRYDERTRLLTVRVAVLALGILAFGAGGPALRGIADSPTTGYLLMALVCGVVIGASMLVASTTARQAQPVVHHLATGGEVGDITNGDITSGGITNSYRHGLAVLRRSPALRMLLGAFLIQGLATGLMLAGAQYIATWVLDSEGAVSVLFAALIGPALICTPLWGRLAHRIGKERGFAVATVVFAVAAASLIGLQWGHGWWVYGAIGLAGAAYAGMQSLPMAMLPDVITTDQRRHHTSSAGVIGGVWTAGETTGMALGAVVFTAILTIGGYLSAAQSVTEQPASALTAMVVGFSLVPAALALLSLLFIARYPLRRRDIDALIEPEGMR